MLGYRQNCHNADQGRTVAPNVSEPCHIGTLGERCHCTADSVTTQQRSDKHDEIL